MDRRIRVPAAAGLFYPSDPEELHRTVRRLLSCADRPARLSPKAVIVPHAGYLYSGATAARAYATLRPEEISRVVLIGPAHRALLRGIAAPESLIWQTPIGDVLIDFEALEKISLRPQVLFSEAAHEQEHCLEVQLPFLRELLGESFQMIPLVVGDSSPDEVAEILEMLWGGPETVVVVSSDLSHYLAYADALSRDRLTATAIETLDLHLLEQGSACGLNAIAGLVCLAQRCGLRAELLDLCNSGDTAGAKETVVGYGAFAFYE